MGWRDVHFNPLTGLADINASNFMVSRCSQPLRLREDACMRKDRKA